MVGCTAEKWQLTCTKLLQQNGMFPELAKLCAALRSLCLMHSYRAGETVIVPSPEEDWATRQHLDVARDPTASCSQCGDTETGE